MDEGYDDPMRLAYGPFQPGTAARALRHDNAQRGYRTCWYCLTAFRPERVIDGDGKLHRLGRGRWYCSAACAREDRRHEDRARLVAQLDADTLVLDLRRCRECA